MKKIILNTIYITILLVLALGFALVESQKPENIVKRRLKNLYSIKTGNKNEIGDSDYIMEMKTDDMTFYIYTFKDSYAGGFITTNIYTSILSSVYEKYQNQIKNIGLKYGINVTYNYSSDKYHYNEDYFDGLYIYEENDYFLTIESDDMDSVKKFVNEILSIEEIKSLYDIWFNSGSNYRIVCDYSEIIIDGEKTYKSIFDLYKSNQEISK